VTWLQKQWRDVRDALLKEVLVLSAEGMQLITFHIDQPTTPLSESTGTMISDRVVPNVVSHRASS